MSYFEKISPLSVTEVAKKVLGWKIYIGTNPCPLHGETSGKAFSVTKDNLHWNCFGKCGKGGDAITLVAEEKKISYSDACTLIAKDFPESFNEIINPKPAFEYDEEHLDVFDTLTSLANFGSTRLFSHAKVLNYMKSNRLFSEDTIKKYLFGYISKEDYENLEHLIDDYLNPDVLYSFKRHVGRLLIPLFNSSGKNVIGFVSRSLSKTDKIKYINDNDSELKYGYHKKFYTYGYAQANRNKPVVIVEGYLDGPSLMQLGINTVAMGDCSLPEPRFKYLFKNFSQLILGLDNDVAGVRRTLELKYKYNDINFSYVLWNKSVKDANDFLRQGKTEFVVGDYFEYLRNLWMNNWNDVQNNYHNRKDFINRIKTSVSDISYGDENYFVRCEIDKFIESVIAD